LIYEARDLGYSPNVAPLEPDYAALQIEHTETMPRRPDLAGMNAARVSSFDLTPTYLKENWQKVRCLFHITMQASAADTQISLSTVKQNQIVKT
jgi:hypothetical protein